MTDTVPPGFVPLPPIDDVMTAFAPIHYRRDDDGHIALGLFVGPQHCNIHGSCHGGAWACLADVQLGINVGVMTGRSGPTVSLSLDYMGAAAAGQWIEGHTRLLRQTSRLAFVDAIFTVDGAIALRANATFRLVRTPDRILSGD